MRIFLYDQIGLATSMNANGMCKAIPDSKFMQDYDPRENNAKTASTSEMGNDRATTNASSYGWRLIGTEWLARIVVRINMTETIG